MIETIAVEEIIVVHEVTMEGIDLGLTEFVGVTGGEGGRTFLGVDGFLETLLGLFVREGEGEDKEEKGTEEGEGD